jgi:hypothetical protein
LSGEGGSVSADKSGDWRNWSFLTLQVELAAEGTRMAIRNQLFDVYDPEPPA